MQFIVPLPLKRILTAPQVCPDSTIARNGPMMVQRILNILAESKNIWPLASRWYDHLEKFHKSQNAVAAGAEGSMADSVSTTYSPPRKHLSLTSRQREPIPHVLHPAPNRPTVKPIQPRIVAAPGSDEKNGVSAQSANVNTAMLALQQQQQPTSVLYNDSNTRLSSTQSQPPPSLSPQQVAGAARPTTDGLGLLIEAFDTHQTAATTPAQAVPGTSATAPPGTVYDAQAAPQQYYAQPALAMNDGYEHELGYYMSDGVPQVMPQQSWAGEGGMYGY